MKKLVFFIGLLAVTLMALPDTHASTFVADNTNITVCYDISMSVNINDVVFLNSFEQMEVEISPGDNFVISNECEKSTFTNTLAIDYGEISKSALVNSFTNSYEANECRIANDLFSYQTALNRVNHSNERQVIAIGYNLFTYYIV